MVDGARPLAENAPGDMGRYRPLRGGIAIAAVPNPTNLEGEGTGTLGCIVVADGVPDEVYALTCSHVVGTTEFYTSIARPFGQPTTASGSSDCCRGVFGASVAYGADRHDAALIRLEAGTEWLAEIEGIVDRSGIRVPIAGTATVTEAEIGSETYQVLKRGRRTGLTGGVLVTPTESPTRTMDGRSHDNPLLVRPNGSTPDDARWMAQGGDSGSVLVNEANQVLGLVVSLLPHRTRDNLPDPTRPGYAVVVPIDRILTALTAARNANLGGSVTLRIATATRANDVRRVPGTRSAGRSEAWPVRQDLDQTLAATERGRAARDLWSNHGTEIQRLIQTNRRVGALWQRNGGGAIVQAFVRCSYRIDDPLPDSIDGRKVDDAVDTLADVVTRYGSPRLQADVLALRGHLPTVGGKSIREILSDRVS